MIGDITVADDIYIVCGYFFSAAGVLIVLKSSCGNRMALYCYTKGFLLLREDIVGQEIRTKSEVFHGVSLTGFFQASILSSLRLSEPLNDSSSAFVHFS